MAVALAIFIGGIILAWRAADVPGLVPGPVLANILLVPLSIAATNWQLRVLSSAVDATVGWKRALRVTTLGTLSSLLPVSSGAIVRAGALVYWGGSAQAVGRTLVFDALVWVSLSFLAAGSCAMWLGHALIAGFFLVGWVVTGFAALAAGGVIVRGVRLRVLLARSLGICTEIVRLTAAFLALGAGVTLAHATLLNAPGSLASLFFFLPGGLGVQESLTALLAELIGLNPGIAFLAVALSRMLGLTTVLAWELILWLIGQLNRAS